MPVRLLPDTVINKIAAGEIIERPASVVKELVENSLDAQATQVVVELEDGGRRCVSVSDNGSGMSKDDALLAIERHATSKIRSAEDLTTIATLGFRGEALPSIAAVSKFSLLTCEAQRAVGCELQIAAGVLQQVRESVRSPGTQICARNLFFNLPARRKFLRTGTTEERRVRAVLRAFALSHPHVQLRLLLDGRGALSYSSTSGRLGRAQEIFGAEGSAHRAPAPDAAQGALEMYLLHPRFALAEQAELILVVNQRIVSDRLLLRAVKDGYQSTIKEREFPVGVLWLDLPPQLLDVNVHPRKNEVRFQEPQRIYQWIVQEVQRCVQQFRSPLAPTSTLVEPVYELNATQQASAANCSWLEGMQGSGLAEQAPSFGAAQLNALSAHQLSAPLAAGWSRASGDTSGTGAALPSSNFVLESPGKWSGRADLHTTSAISTMPASKPTIKVFSYSALRYVGQILGCYLLTEDQQQLYVIDLHAAHERYNYNLIRNRYRQRSLVSQQLLVPQEIFTGQEGLQRLLEADTILRAFGFELEAFGPESVVLRAVPALLGKSNPEGLVKELAGCLEGSDISARMEERIDHICARLACHASVRSGDQLTHAEVQELFRALDSSEFSAACPHGRPVVVRFSQREIENWFGRHD